jgi:hypothetical protein
VPTLLLTLSTAKDFAHGQRAAGVYGEFVLSKRHAVVFLKFSVQQFLEFRQVDVLPLDHLPLSSPCVSASWGLSSLISVTLPEVASQRTTQVLDRPERGMSLRLAHLEIDVFTSELLYVVSLYVYCTTEVDAEEGRRPETGGDQSPGTFMPLGFQLGYLERDVTRAQRWLRGKRPTKNAAMERV